MLASDLGHFVTKTDTVHSRLDRRIDAHTLEGLGLLSRQAKLLVNQRRVVFLLVCSRNDLRKIVCILRCEGLHREVGDERLGNTIDTNTANRDRSKELERNCLQVLESIERLESRERLKHRDRWLIVFWPQLFCGHVHFLFSRTSLEFVSQR